MSFWKRNGQPSTGRDPFERLAKRVALLEADVDRLEAGWGDTKDALKRMMARIEKAAWRLDKSEEAGPGPTHERDTAAPASESSLQKQARLARLARGA
jgi:hypothetical protein